MAPAEAPRIEPQVNNSAAVLIVDDDPAARESLTANLNGAGYRLVHAASGDEALSLARKIHPDAITLDVMMPKQLAPLQPHVFDQHTHSAHDLADPLSQNTCGLGSSFVLRRNQQNG